MRFSSLFTTTITLLAVSSLALSIPNTDKPTALEAEKAVTVRVNCRLEPNNPVCHNGGTGQLPICQEWDHQCKANHPCDDADSFDAVGLRGGKIPFVNCWWQDESGNEVELIEKRASDRLQPLDKVNQRPQTCQDNNMGVKCNFPEWRLPTVCKYERFTKALISGNKSECLETPYLPTLGDGSQCIPPNELSSVRTIKSGECLSVCILKNSCPKTYPCKYEGKLGAAFEAKSLSCSSVIIHG